MRNFPIRSLCIALVALSFPAESPAREVSAIELEIDKLEAAAKHPRAGAAAWIRLGDAKMQEARDQLSHDFTAAGAAYQKALELDETATQALVGMAWVKNSEHLFAEGVQWAQKALALDPRLPDAHALIGDYALELGNYDEAYDHYQAALNIRPNLSSYARAGQLLWLTGDPVQAMLLMEKAIAAGGPYPENAAWCRAELALMQFNSGALLAAEAQARKARESAPENPRVIAVLARIEAARGHFEEAIALYRKSAELAPSHDALAALVDLYQLTGDPMAAKEQSERLVAYHKPPKETFTPRRFHTQPNRHDHPHDQFSAEFAFFLADHDQRIGEAVSEAEEVYKTYKNIKVEDTLAWCCYKAGDHQRARRHIERAMKWKTPDPLLYYHGGMIFLKLDDKKRARELLAKATNLNPNFHPIHSKIAADTLESLSGK